jgi:preprotein translocase subunit YajC
MLWQLLVAAAEETGKNGGGQNTGSSGGGLMTMLLPLILIGVVFYFLLIRPQQKQRREQQAMLNSVRRGDEVVTLGGIHGRIEGLKDKSVMLKVAEGVKIELNKSSIAQVTKRRDEDEGGLQQS